MTTQEFHQGQLVSQSELQIPPFERTVGDLSTLFGQADIEHILLYSDQPLTGINLSGNNLEQLLFANSIANTPRDHGTEVDGIYFPGDTQAWQRREPSDLGWDVDLLNQALELAGTNRSSAVTISQHGYLLAERTWAPNGTNRSGQSSIGLPMEDVASVQKSICSLLATIARDRGLLDIEKPVQAYLGSGWSQSPSSEPDILVRHVLSMTSGLNESFGFRSPPGTRWQYNTPVYSIMHDILEAATGLTLEHLTREWLTQPLHMHETYWNARAEGSSNDTGLVTHVRDMTRVGICMLARGAWRGQELIQNKQLLAESVSPSQDLNLEYGYLWWLNQTGTLITTAPRDLIAAQGANGRRIYIVPSMGLVIARTGSNPSNNFYRNFWDMIMQAAPESQKSSH